jgi:hypothetical protein
MSVLTDLSASGLCELIRRRVCSAEEVVKSCFDNVHRLAPTVKAFVRRLCSAGAVILGTTVTGVRDRQSWPDNQHALIIQGSPVFLGQIERDRNLPISLHLPKLNINDCSSD